MRKIRGSGVEMMKEKRRWMMRVMWLLRIWRRMMQVRISAEATMTMSWILRWLKREGERKSSS